jgi:hypothetical protein
MDRIKVKRARVRAGRSDCCFVADAAACKPPRVLFLSLFHFAARNNARTHSALGFPLPAFAALHFANKMFAVRASQKIPADDLFYLYLCLDQKIAPPLINKIIPPPIT